MIKKPNMIIVGAAGRNVGKTEFACELIKRFQKTERVVGIKITSIRERNGQCPRGGAGCGVCSSLAGDYMITEETSETGPKDTVRMLRAGAGKVLWLRVLHSALEEGMQALFEQIPENACIVCESNSSRTVVEPGLFVVVKEKGMDTVKSTCRNVLHYADKVILFDGSGWDVHPSRLEFRNGQWKLPQQVTAIVLSGGKSRRMGRDKSLLNIDGKPMISRIIDTITPLVDECIVSANDIEKYAFLNLPIVPDREADKGPLMGILSCLEHSSNHLNFVIACDMPDPDTQLISQMIELAKDADIVMPRRGEDCYEPLIAIYKKSIIPAARQLLKEGKRRIIELFNYVDVSFIEPDESRWNRNLNTAEEYSQYLKQEATK